MIIRRQLEEIVKTSFLVKTNFIFMYFNQFQKQASVTKLVTYLLYPRDMYCYAKAACKFDSNQLIFTKHSDSQGF